MYLRQIIFQSPFKLALQARGQNSKNVPTRIQGPYLERYDPYLQSSKEFDLSISSCFNSNLSNYGLQPVTQRKETVFLLNQLLFQDTQLHGFCPQFCLSKGLGTWLGFSFINANTVIS